MGREALTNAELFRRIKRNRVKRERASKNLADARAELLMLVRTAEQLPDGPQMNTIAQLAGLDRRTLFDLRRNDRKVRTGAGSERA